MTTLKVSSPAELLSAVPFLVGFHPADSLIVVAMHGPRITSAVRTDLPEHDTPEDEAKAAVLHLATVVLQHGAEAVTIIGYGEESRATPAVALISNAFRKEGVPVVDELRVTDGRYWSYLCKDVACCPPEGQPCEPAFSVVATEATFAGAVALPSREALAAQLESVTGDEREAMIAATARALLRLAALAAERPPAPDISNDEGAGEHEEAASDRGSPGIVHRAHNRAAPFVEAATSAPGRLGSTELHLSNVIWASLGLATPSPHQPETAAKPEGPETAPRPDGSGRREGPAGPEGPGEPKGPGEPEEPRKAEVPGEPESAAQSRELLADEDYFFALIRRAGRTAVQEAERCYSAGGRLTDDETAWLGILLLNMPVRDYAWTRTRTHEWELALWSDLTRRVEPRYLPAPASLLAFVAWRMGLGPLASVAVERALDQKIDYSLANLLQGALVAGLPPSVLDGWPVLDGLTLTDPDFDLDDDPQPRVPGHFPPSRAAGPADRPEQDRIDPAPQAPVDAGETSPAEALPSPAASRISPAEAQRSPAAGDARNGTPAPKAPPLPKRIRSDAAPSESRGGAGGPGRRDKRPQTSRRASHHRI